MVAMLSYIFSFCVFLLFYKLIIPLCITLFKYVVLMPIFSKRKIFATAGEWAIITGATDGIGKAFAEELAKDGLNILLISRTTEKLEKVAFDIQTTYKVKTKIFTADLCKTHFYGDLEKEIASLSSIAYLVNNVGISLSIPDYYASGKEMNQTFIQNLINCNILSISSLTRMVMQKMEAQKTPGIILNLSSFSGCVPIPLLALYAASKAFVLHFSKTLSLEANHVKVKTVIPNFVSTAMTMNRRPSLFVPAAKSYVQSVLNSIGVEAHGPGYLPHAIVEIVIFALPTFIQNKIFLMHMKEIRAKTLVKLEKMSKKSS